MAFPWEKALSVGATLVGTLLGSKAASSAQKQTQQAAQQATQRIDQQAAQTRTDLEPWRKAGTNALAQLTKLTTPGAMPPAAVEAQLRATPGFAFREAELQKAIDRRHAATGNRFSGRGMKEMTRWMDSNLYEPAYRQWTNDLMTLAGYGREGNQMMSSIGANAAAQGGNAIMTAGDAAAQAAIAKNALYNNAFQSITDTLAPNPFLQRYLGG